MANSEPFRNLPPLGNMDATIDSSPPAAPSDAGSETSAPNEPSPFLVRTHLPSSAVEAFGMIGGYQLLEKLGEGGMGTVYLAEDVALRRRVALKVMKPNIASEKVSRDRFLREARAAAQLDHDNIVAIHQIGEDNGQPFLAMPLLRGETLSAYLTRVPKPDIQFVLKVGRDVAMGLAAAHAQGLVHRDIKPDNIWIEPIQGEGVGIRAKILDFGLARPRQEDGTSLTRQGAFLGTPAYVAPEQARGLEVDQRTDLFSLGCVLYEMCAGRRPFVGVDTMAVLTALISEEPHDPRTMNPDIPPALSMLIKQMLEKEPNRRPASAVIVADLLKQLQNSVVNGVPPPMIGRPVDDMAWQRDESRSILPWFLVGVLILACAGGYALYRYVPPAGPGGIEIVISEEANLAYAKSNGLSVYDATGKTVKRLLATERSLRLPVGTYTAKVDGTNLEIRIEENGEDLPAKKKVEFKIDPGKVARLKVVPSIPVQEIKSNDSKIKS